MAVSDVYDAILKFDRERIGTLVQSEIDAGVEVSNILNDGLIAAMDYVGDQFDNGTMYFPEMLSAAQTMKAALAVLRPHLGSGKGTSSGTVVIGTVKGDLHDIGKNLVGMMLEGAGFQVIDLGFNVPAEEFAKAARDHTADLVAMSALLTTTMPEMGKVVRILEEDGIRDQCKVIVGGAPVTQAFADSIGADGYGADGPAGVELARRLTR